MQVALCGTVWLSVLLCACSGSVAEPTPGGEPSDSRSPTVLEDLAYRETATPSRRQSLDLYLPEEVDSPPLFVFLHGGFWSLSDDRAGYRIGAEIARALVEEDVAVALVRYRLAPDNPHPAAADDTAAAVAYLVREAPQYGYDPERIVLAGHSAGGHLAALIGLDPSYLQAHGLAPDALHSVIGLSGIFDVTPPIPTHVGTFGLDLTARVDASPIEHVDSEAPPFLLIAGGLDMPGFARGSKDFARALRRAGHEPVEWRVLPEFDHFSLVRWGAQQHPAMGLALAWMRGEPLAAQVPHSLAGDPPREKQRTWQELEWMKPFEPFAHLEQTYPADERFLESLDVFFGDSDWRQREEYSALASIENYHAIGLFALLDALGVERTGTGPYVMIRNQRDELLVWRDDEIAEYEPVIVTAIDDVRELFGITFGYRARKQYSWRDDLPDPPDMARPLGAFLHFRVNPPAELRPLVLAPFSLLPHSFSRTELDPYAPIRDVPPDLFEVLTWRNGCVYCHSFRGVGTRSFHTMARNAKPHGGFALPLAEYPPDVWKSFVFEPQQAADAIGVTPNVVAGDAARKLYEAVEAGR